MDFISSMDDRNHQSNSWSFSTEKRLIKEFWIKKIFTIYKYFPLIKKIELLSKKMTHRNRILIASSYMLFFLIMLPLWIFWTNETLNEQILKILFFWVPIFIWFYRLYELTIYNQWVFIQKTIIKLWSEVINYDELDAILIKTYRIYNIYRRVLWRKSLIKLMYGEKIFLVYMEIITGISEFFYKILTDLRSDLSIRLAEQQQSLESARSEVEKNIAWTTELNQVSELQRARLDRQIEQFEELQRVLVKV